MRKFILILCLLNAISTLAQVPQAIKYQAVTRDTAGNILVSHAISMRISILGDSTGGDVLYSETHSLTTNAYGLATLDIGLGLVVSGSFSAIDWSHGGYFVRVEADASGGSDFSLLGISQLLSVPYALYAGSAGTPSMTDEERDALTDPPVGMIIYNVTTGCLNVRKQDSWYQDCNLQCVPQPTLPNAGPDVTSCGDSAVQLSANTALKGIGTWSLLSGQGGVFADIHDPQTNFTGAFDQTYTLQWQIANHCNTLYDEVTVSFIRFDTAQAGPDQSFYAWTTSLAAAIPGQGYIGTWSIISGLNGVISDTHNAASAFTGELGQVYTLRWTISSTCDSSHDDVVIRCCPTHIPADAGEDIVITLGTSCQLHGSVPWEHNSGLWTIVSGTGGTFSDHTLYYATFTGEPDTLYTLRWTITSICDTSSDDVTVTTAPLWNCGSVVAYGGMNYNTVQIGSQCWMKENLNIGTMVIAAVGMSNNGVIEKFCYNNLTSNCDEFGGLYNWYEMMNYGLGGPGVKGICPDGFHIPTGDEWNTLVNFLGGPSVAGGKMKETGFTHWFSPNQGATNESQFTALGGGRVVANAEFESLRYYGEYWSASDELSGDAWGRIMNSISAGIYPIMDWKGYGSSVRCLKD
jgi:uncharacterized protein (TIGR02145 family)